MNSTLIDLFGEKVSFEPAPKLTRMSACLTRPFRATAGAGGCAGATAAASGHPSPSLDVAAMPRSRAAPTAATPVRKSRRRMAWVYIR